MMVPAHPIAYLIMRQAGLTFAALQAFFNAMCGLGDPCKSGQRCLGSAIGEIKVNLHHLLLISIPIAHHHRHLLMAFLTLRGTRHHRAFDALDDQRAFGAIADVDWRPGVWGQRGAPLVETLPGTQQETASAARRRWRCR